MAEMKSHHFTTRDGVMLHYLEAGAGDPIVMIPGWSQSAEQFKFQIEGLGEHFHVFAIDMRGHGESEKPNFGYRIQRLAADTHEFLVEKGIKNAALLGHSMGCSVIWCYYDLYGSERLSRLILVDEPPLLTSNPTWTAEELQNSGAIFDPAAVTGTVNALAGPDGEATTIGFIGGMLTKNCPADLKEWIIARNFRMPREHAATLLYNHCHQDWRDVIPRIGLPTLLVGGRVSLVPWKSVDWMHRQIPGSTLVIFEEEEGGQHFMFIENPDKFNQVVVDFMQSAG